MTAASRPDLPRGSVSAAVGAGRCEARPPQPVLRSLLTPLSRLPGLCASGPGRGSWSSRVVGAGAARRPRVQAEAPGTRPDCCERPRLPFARDAAVLAFTALAPAPLRSSSSGSCEPPAVRFVGLGASGQAKGHRGVEARAGPEQGLLGLLSVFVHCFKKKKFSVHSIGEMYRSWGK